MTTFYLIRHGETAWNATGRWQGHADVPLNDVGRAQAARLAARLVAENVRFDALYSSDLQRAWATADAVAQALGLTPIALPAIREIDIGSWSGLTAQQIREFDAETLERVNRGEDLPRGGAERRADLDARIGAAIERLARKHPQQTLGLVTHGGSIRAALAHIMQQMPDLTIPHQHIGNTSITIVVRTPEGWDVVTVNDMAHLAGAAQAPDLMSAPPDDAERA